MAASENAGGRVAIYTTYGNPIQSNFHFQLKVNIFLFLIYRVKQIKTY